MVDITLGRGHAWSRFTNPLGDLGFAAQVEFQPVPPPSALPLATAPAPARNVPGLSFRVGSANQQHPPKRVSQFSPRLFLLEHPRAATRTGVGTPVHAADRNSSFSPASNVSRSWKYVFILRPNQLTRTHHLHAAAVQERGVEASGRWPEQAALMGYVPTNQGREIKGTFLPTKSLAAHEVHDLPFKGSVQCMKSAFYASDLEGSRIIQFLFPSVTKSSMQLFIYPRRHVRGLRKQEPSRYAKHLSRHSEHR